MAAAGNAAGLIDTDILIDAQRGFAHAEDFLDAQRVAGGLSISVISAMELVVGCRNAEDLSKVQQFLQRVRLVPISVAASQTAYSLVESFYLSHSLLIPDALVAATALEYNGTLYTKNVRHFRMIPRLNVVRPY